MNCSTDCTKGCLLRLVAAVVLSSGLVYFFVAQKTKAPSAAVFQLNQTMRKLWSDHVIWTRDYIIAAVAGSPDQKVAETRLMKNQEDLGNAVGSVYGNDAGKKMTDLLKEHIALAGEVVAAAKANDTATLDESNKKWHQNAEDIATFLSSANPAWPKQDVLAMLNEHLKLTTEEAVARIKQDWNADVTAFDNIFNQILGMADTLTNGIVAQFPDKFK